MRPRPMFDPPLPSPRAPARPLGTSASATAEGGARGRAPAAAVRLTALIATLLLAVFPATAPADDEGAEERHTIARLMKLSRLDETIGTFTDTARDGLVEGLAPGRGDRAERDGRPAIVERAARRGFAPERMRTLVATHLARALGPRDVERLLGHYDSPLGRRVLEAEHTRRATEQPAAFARFAARLGGGAEDTERLALMKRLVVEGGVAERLARLTVELRVVSLHATAGIAGNREAAARWLSRAVPKVLATREGLERSLRRRLPPMLAFTYAELPVADLRGLVDHAVEPASLRMANGLFDGLREGFVAATSEIGTRVDAALEFAEASEEI